MHTSFVSVIITKNDEIVVIGIDEDYYGLALLYDDNFNIKWAKKILILSQLIIFLINIYHMFF